MLSLRRRLEIVRRTGPDAGITLTELLVTVVLMSIVCGLALTWLLGENTTDTKTQNSTYALGGARNVLQAWPALLQVADSPWNGQTSLPPSGSPTPTPTATVAQGSYTGRFLAISPNSITFNADVANAPASSCANSCLRVGSTTQVTLALVNGALTQTLVQSGTANRSITFVPSGAALTSNAAGTTCLFDAYDVNGNELGCSTGAAASLGSIARLVLAFSVTPSRNGSPQTYQTSANVTGTFAPVVSAAPSASAGV